MAAALTYYKSPTLKKGTFAIRSFRGHESMETWNQTKDPVFLICFSSPNCLGNSFLLLKIAKIHFHEVPPLAHSGLQNTWILEVKVVRLGFCAVLFRKHMYTLKKIISRFYFFYRVENKFQIFRVVSWSRCGKWMIPKVSMERAVGTFIR